MGIRTAHYIVSVSTLQCVHAQFCRMCNIKQWAVLKVPQKCCSLRQLPNSERDMIALQNGYVLGHKSKSLTGNYSVQYLRFYGRWQVDAIMKLINPSLPVSFIIFPHFVSFAFFLHFDTSILSSIYKCSTDSSAISTCLWFDVDLSMNRTRAPLSAIPV